VDLLPAEVTLDPNGRVFDAHLLPAPLPAAHMRLGQGKWFGLRLQNRSSRDLYAAVLAISADGAINLLFGGDGQGENRIAAGETRSPLLSTAVARLKNLPGQRVVIKVIATDSFVDFSDVDTTRARTVVRAGRPLARRAVNNAPLQRLLEGIGQGEQRGPIVIQPSHWGTTDASITIE
jgi:hypothetical protein